MIKYTNVETCLVCNENHARELFYFQSKDDQWYHALKCRNCGLVFASPQPVLTREAIQDRVWMAADSISNTVDVYIRMLRKKIDTGHTVKMIHTVHGVGYTLRLPSAEAPE